ncbi:AMP-binding protein [Aestuariivivens insulae]|uniref:AMP-binding protein n=1 Tax=Aestuariivivens insulae TaxID=1621988 RepID=UPI001F58144C|nr:AMP-binding protein [Aestuariivivens insulae]
MYPTFKNVHLKFELNGKYYSYEDLNDVAYSFIKEGEPYQQALGVFLLDWLDGKDYIVVQTSGSTGAPKPIKIKKQAMVNSAIATGDFFNLRPGDTALHCLPSNFIAGKMMLIRAIILGLKLDVVSPSSKPLIDIGKTYQFSAMTPFQVENSLDDMDLLKTLIIGGGQVSQFLKERLKHKQVHAFETYGMTETVTHIAIKKLNNFSAEKQGKTAFFETLPHVTVSQDKRNCLVIDAPKLSDNKIVTNDVVELHSKTTFEWLGRYDNVINSGGVKLFPELIEQKLSEVIKQRFFVTSLPDDQLGEQVILVIEHDGLDTVEVSSAIKKLKSLHKYEIPKQIFTLPKFIETKTGKIQRSKTLALLNR